MNGHERRKQDRSHGWGGGWEWGRRREERRTTCVIGAKYSTRKLLSAWKKKSGADLP